jgi:hypothetical protein
MPGQKPRTAFLLKLGAIITSSMIAGRPEMRVELSSVLESPSQALSPQLGQITQQLAN